MRSLLRRRPSPALVVACAALLVALGGTAVAAVVALPDGSVGTAQLADDAVVSAKIRDGSVTSHDIANSTILGTDIRDRTLTKADFRKGSLLPGPRGPLGPQGPQGEKGAPGTSGYQVVQNETPLTSASPKGVTVLCPPGKKAISGGADVSGEGRDRDQRHGDRAHGRRLAGPRSRARQDRRALAPSRLRRLRVCCDLGFGNDTLLASA